MAVELETHIQMNTFTPIFRSLVDSSLASEPDHVFKTFVMLLAIKDSDHVARITAFGLGRKCWPLEPGKSEQRALDALKVLMKPDKTRIEPQPFEGRRVEKVVDGYFILNGQSYEDLMREVGRKFYKARKEREYRAAAKKTSKLDPHEARHLQLEKNGASQAEIDANITSSLPEKCR